MCIRDRVRAHVGQYGNEIVDGLAKEAAKGENVLCSKMPIPKSHTNKVIKSFIQSQWQNQWINSNKYAEAKSFIPRFRPKTAEAMVRLPRDEFSRMARWMSGFNGLAKHEKHFNPEVMDDRCRLCSGPMEMYDEEETAVHLTFHCPKLVRRGLSVSNSG